jgi:hypothetical protein
MFVGGVVVENDVDRLVGGNLALDSVEKATPRLSDRL